MEFQTDQICSFTISVMWNVAPPEQYWKLQLQLPKICWGAHGMSLITRWMCAGPQPEVLDPRYKEYYL